MSFFWKLKKSDDHSLALELKKNIRELNNVDITYLWDHIRGLEIECYEVKRTKVPVWVRLTLPFGLITYTVLFIGMPINFMFTGQWGYKWLWLKNWFVALGF